MKVYLETKPHLGYYLIKKYIEDNKLEYFIFTSNVDCMWKKAGFDKNKIIECHGSLDYLQSLSNQGPIWETNINEINNIKYNKETYKCDISTIPKSIYDNKYARPNVCLFNDIKYFNTARLYKLEKIFNKWYMNMLNLNKKIVVIEIGAGVIVPTVRRKSEKFVKDYLININNKNDYVKLIRINPVYTDVPKGHISIPLTGLKALELLLT